LQDGKIVEMGFHQQLLLKGGLYKHLYEMQFKG
jgi:ABC-type multidrug transport system fused ATPase/permease subunit